MAVRPIDAGSLRDNITDIYGGSDRLIYLADVLSLIEAQPTLTPPNEWVSVEDRLPEDRQIVLFHQKDGFIYCAEYLAGVKGLPPAWLIDNDSWEGENITHWMALPAPPDKDNNVLAKTPNEPLTLEQLRQMDGEPVWIVDVGPHKWYGPGWAIVDRNNCLVRTAKNWNPVFFERYGERWLAYRRPPEGEA